MYGPRGRYGAHRTVYKGITFDSELECRYYKEVLEPLLSAKKITDLKLQPEFELIPDFIKDGTKIRGIKYIADFQFFDASQDRLRIIDVKGEQTEAFILRHKLFEFRYKDYHLELLGHANYCGWVEVAYLNELIRIRKRYRNYKKELKAGTITKAKLRMMDEIRSKYNKYIGEEK